MTLLCLDCGNTRIKWGMREGDRWQALGAVATADVAALGEILRNLAPPARAIGCNVAGREVASSIERLLAELGMAIIWAESLPCQCGVKNSYDDPKQLGVDRWAALIGARALVKSAVLVVGAGTATTIDVLDAAGVFLGGVILPGLALMRRALALNTAQLPDEGGRFQALPHNTPDAMTSGCLLATAGAIDRSFAHIAAEPGAVCLLFGGAAEALLPLLKMPVRRLDNLVLEGLVRMAPAE